MKDAQFAALVGDDEEGTEKLGALLDFLGIEWKMFPTAAEFLKSASKPYAILAPLPAIAQLFQGRSENPALHSLFAFGSRELAAATRALTTLTSERQPAFASLTSAMVTADVSASEPEITGPMHGLKVTLQPRTNDRVAKLKQPNSCTPLIATDEGAAFFSVEKFGARVFVSASGEIPDLAAPVSGKGYDVRNHFLSAVPLLLYLKWAFRDVCWQPNETGACWIVDDPLLRTRYGFCDFPLLDAQMREHNFSTNIAMIPWNSRRTSEEMATLIKRSGGRLSVSMHGCDHTAREFATSDRGALEDKVTTASTRMDEHRARTGIEHHPIMVFPQGKFSRESLAVLQEHNFTAALNTETLPDGTAAEHLTVRDVWSVASQHYGSFPLFTRRYPMACVENFAFDILLGKPCLIVEHHGFFKDKHADVLGFAKTLNALNAPLRWRGLGDVIRRSYLRRTDVDGIMHVRMFANELLLENRETVEQEYRIEKADAGSVGVKAVTADGCGLEWRTNGSVLTFSCKIPPGAERLIRVSYKSSSEKIGKRSPAFAESAKVAARRYLSEFRDNFLSRHDGLMSLAQRAKRLAGKSRLTNG